MNSTLYMPYTEISLSMFFSFLSTITLKKLTSIANSVSATVVLTKCLYCICYIRFCLLKSCVKNDKNRTLLQGSLDVNPCEVLVSCYLNIKQLYVQIFVFLIFLKIFLKPFLISFLFYKIPFYSIFLTERMVKMIYNRMYSNKDVNCKQQVV